MKCSFKMSDVGKILTDVDSKVLLESKPFTFWVPTEVILTEPKYVIPMQGRIYQTKFILWDDKIQDIEKVQKNYKTYSDYGSYYGYGNLPKIYLKECWEDEGGDGHTNYIMKGWLVELKV